MNDVGNDTLDSSRGSQGGPAEIDSLKQKTKSLKRKLRKWRKSARSALNEVCPSSGPDSQTEMVLNIPFLHLILI